MPNTLRGTIDRFGIELWQYGSLIVQYCGPSIGCLTVRCADEYEAIMLLRWWSRM